MCSDQNQPTVNLRRGARCGRTSTGGFRHLDDGGMRGGVDLQAEDVGAVVVADGVEEPA